MSLNVSIHVYLKFRGHFVTHLYIVVMYRNIELASSFFLKRFSCPSSQKKTCPGHLIKYYDKLHLFEKIVLNTFCAIAYIALGR